MTLRETLSYFSLSSDSSVVADRVPVRGTLYSNDTIVLQYNIGELKLGQIFCIVVTQEKSVILVLREKRAALVPSLGLHEVMEVMNRPNMPIGLKLDHLVKCRTKLRQIAQQMVEQYPKSFLDGDIIVGNGCEFLMLQMENSFENCLRQSMQTLSKNAPKRPKHSEKYGCVDWQPSCPVNADDHESKRFELCRSHKENLLLESRVKQLI